MADQIPRQPFLPDMTRGPATMLRFRCSQMFHKHMRLVKNVEGWRLSGGLEFFRADILAFEFFYFSLHMFSSPPFCPSTNPRF